MDEMSFDIVLNHCEKWAGGGYPGKVPDIMSDVAEMGTPKTGEEIPLAARITSLADVYDALSSRRSYKEPWTEERVISEIEKDSGCTVDPELVEVFFQIYNVVKAIREKSWE
jgi:response regulator RpfG family c-di-GMP phosphodiesterase